jgi:hypothetical protein
MSHFLLEEVVLLRNKFDIRGANMINVDTKLLEALKASTCFGIAHDESVPECKQCDVRAQCKVKSEGELNIPTPKGKSAVSQPVKEVAKKEAPPKKAPAKKTDKPSTPAKKSTPAPKKATPSKSGSGDIPDFKTMTLDELKALANLRSVEWKDFNNDQITRMRLIMALKKSY